AYGSPPRARSHGEDALQFALVVRQASISTGGGPEGVRGRVVHVGRGPRTDRRGTRRHLYPRRLTSEVLPKPHILSSTVAGGNPPGRNAAAGCRRTIKQSLRIPYRTSEEERRVMPVLFDFRQLNNVIRKDPTRSRGSTTLSTRWRVHNGFRPWTWQADTGSGVRSAPTIQQRTYFQQSNEGLNDDTPVSNCRFNSASVSAVWLLPALPPLFPNSRFVADILALKVTEL
ncbi:hypothetical protein T08_5224, partial [Trichinella sp. T8]